jgi:aspartate/glutamate racemase
MNKLLISRSTLGILSGHSALAGSCFHARFLERVRLMGAAQDSDYPRIVHWSTPLSGLDDVGLDDVGLATGEGARSLKRELATLESFRPHFVAVTCNSLARLVDECRDAGSSAAVAQTPVHAVNALALPGSALVLAAGNARRYEMVQPSAARVDYTAGPHQQWVLDITQAVRSQGLTLTLREELQQFLVGSLARQYDAVVLACTELSALWPDTSEASSRSSNNVVDAMACLLDSAQTTLASQLTS